MNPRYIGTGGILPDTSGEAGTEQAGCTTCQEDLGNFLTVGAIGKCPLISIIHYNSPVARSLDRGYGGETRCPAPINRDAGTYGFGAFQNPLKTEN